MSYIPSYTIAEINKWGPGAIIPAEFYVDIKNSSSFLDSDRLATLFNKLKELLPLHYLDLVHVPGTNNIYIFIVLADEDASNTVETPIPNTLKQLSEIEKELILNTITYCKGNISMASRILGIGRSTVYRKLEIYNGKIK